MLVVSKVVYDVVQRIVHHVVEVEHREARVVVGGNGRSADLGMPSARAAASCAASLRTGVHRHAARGGKHFYGSVGAFVTPLLQRARRAAGENFVAGTLKITFLLSFLAFQAYPSTSQKIHSRDFGFEPNS